MMLMVFIVGLISVFLLSFFRFSNSQWSNFFVISNRSIMEQWNQVRPVMELPRCWLTSAKLRSRGDW
ncbi:hypothetical protein EUTSA_v10011927mg [Eutrema salsugineum]|uniref:Uncharacterized protein n=1 Tax=Eutrema salsugineum TaxID=72664 RepID=V4MH55_EUTSA|nr:hypothetical protein EUTSA_v10011927mg [Eutrema salsugineum]